MITPQIQFTRGKSIAPVLLGKNYWETLVSIALNKNGKVAML